MKAVDEGSGLALYEAIVEDERLTQSIPKFGGISISDRALNRVIFSFH